MLSDHGGTVFLGSYCFYFLCLKTQKWNCWMIWQFQCEFILLFIEAAPIYFLLKSAKGFPLFQILANSPLLLF